MLLKLGIFECEIDRNDKKFIEFLRRWLDAMKEAEAKNEALMRQRRELAGRPV